MPDGIETIPPTRPAAGSIASAGCALLAFFGILLTATLSQWHTTLSASGPIRDDRPAIGGACIFLGGDCAGALMSPDAKVFGIALANIGLAWYAGLLVISLGAWDAGQRNDSRDLRGWATARFLYAASGLPAALWYSYLLAMAAGWIDSGGASPSYNTCPFCLATHAITLLSALLALILFARSERLESAGDQRPSPAPWIALLLAIVVAIGAVGWMRAAEHDRRNARLLQTIDKLERVPGVASVLAIDRMSKLDNDAITAALADMPPISWGPADAPVVLREFADLACHHCTESITMLRDIQKQRPEVVRFELIQFPGSRDCNPYGVQDTKSYTCEASIALLAAHSMGKGDEMLQLILEFPNELGGNPWARFAESIGLDAEDYERERASEAPKRMLNRDMELGGRVGVRDFPTVLINGSIMARHLPTKRILEMVDELANRSFKEPAGAPQEKSEP